MSRFEKREMNYFIVPNYIGKWQIYEFGRCPTTLPICKYTATLLLWRHCSSWLWFHVRPAPLGEWQTTTTFCPASSARLSSCVSHNSCAAPTCKTSNRQSRQCRFGVTRQSFRSEQAVQAQQDRPSVHAQSVSPRVVS